MDTGETLTLIALIMTSIAVIVALFFGVKSIRHARNLQQKAFKQSLLNEIIQWARAVSAQSYAHERGVTRPMWKNDWVILRAEKIGIADIANKIDTSFKPIVDEGIKSFDELDTLLMGESDVLPRNMENEKEKRCKKCMEKCNKIIEAAQSLKVKNIK